MYERALVDVSNIRSLLANARPLVAPQNKARFFSLHKSVRALPSKKKRVFVPLLCRMNMTGAWDKNGKLGIFERANKTMQLPTAANVNRCMHLHVAQCTI